MWNLCLYLFMAYFMNKIRKTNGNSSGKQANCLKRGKTRVITSHVVSKESPIQILIFHLLSWATQTTARGSENKHGGYTKARSRGSRPQTKFIIVEMWDSTSDAVMDEEERREKLDIYYQRGKLFSFEKIMTIGCVMIFQISVYSQPYL